MNNTSASNFSKAGGERRKYPIFNQEYEIVKSLGEGNTSKVYMAIDPQNG